MKKCSVCKKNIAMLFASTYENGKPEMKGLCLGCAKKMNIPGIDDLIKQTGMSEEELSAITEQMNDGVDSFDEGSGTDFLSSFKAPEDQDDINLEEDDTDQSEADDNIDPKQTSKKNRKKKKFLDTFGTNLTDKASKNLIDKVIGREQEIQRVIQILNRRAKNNPVLVGEPGVGKTAIAEGLAVRIAAKQVPSKLLNAEVYLLDMTAVVAGTQFRGQFEGRMKSILTEAQSFGNIILVIDELHNIMGAGEVHGGTMNAANILKPALARGDVQIIGATTLSEYRKHIEKDAALERRFQPVIVDEPTEEESVEILKGIKSYYEDYHEVSIADDVIEAAVKMSNRYITDRFLPDKAIDVLDEAGSRANLVNEVLISIEDYKAQLKQNVFLKDEASEKGDFEGAAYYKAEELRLTKKIESLEENVRTPLTIEDVAHIIESWTKIPVKSITEEEANKLLNLEQRLHERVVGQDEAIYSIARTVRRNRSGFRKRRKPASFIFVGPTGVGKTEVVKALAKEMFGSDDDMIRIDMSEYMERHTVSKLIGSPPGYVGYDEGGQLTEKVRRRPYSVILFDEIEKAHPDVFNMLLQILEDGRLTDAQGRTVFFENTIIVMTSNAGTSYKNKNMGFGDTGTSGENERIKDALKEVFRPEFLNRIDEIVVFNRLSKLELRKIVDLMIKEVQIELGEKGITLYVSDEVKEFLLEKGYDDKYGARPLRRVIQRYVEDEISELYLRKEILDKDAISAIMLDTKVSIIKSHE